MNASERIRFITDIANQLSSEEWDVVDLTLRQFDLPWTDDWQGEKRAYIVEMIQEATEEQLIGLAEHLNITNHVPKTLPEHTPINSTIVRDILIHKGDAGKFLPSGIDIKNYI